jgi:hypothetical protein
MLMSAPIVVYGQWWNDVGSGENEISKGRAVESDRRWNSGSIAMGVLGSSSLGNSQNYLRATFFTLKINKVSFYSGTPPLLLHQSKALDVGFHLVSWLRFGSNFRAQTINFPIVTLM